MRLRMVDKLHKAQDLGGLGFSQYPTVAVRKLRGWTIEYISVGAALAWGEGGMRQVAYYLRDDGQIYGTDAHGLGSINAAVIRDFKTLADKGLVVAGPNARGSLIGSLGAHHSKHHRQG